MFISDIPQYIQAQENAQRYYFSIFNAQPTESSELFAEDFKYSNEATLNGVPKKKTYENRDDYFNDLVKRMNKVVYIKKFKIEFLPEVKNSKIQVKSTLVSIDYIDEDGGFWLNSKMSKTEALTYRINESGKCIFTNGTSQVDLQLQPIDSEKQVDYRYRFRLHSDYVERQKMAQRFWTNMWTSNLWQSMPDFADDLNSTLKTTVNESELPSVHYSSRKELFETKEFEVNPKYLAQAQIKFKQDAYSAEKEQDTQEQIQVDYAQTVFALMLKENSIYLCEEIAGSQYWSKTSTKGNVKLTTQKQDTNSSLKEVFTEYNALEIKTISLHHSLTEIETDHH